jgi:hypothetical protein
LYDFISLAHKFQQSSQAFERPMAHPLLNFFEKTSDVKTINALAVFSKKIQFTAALPPGRSGLARGFYGACELPEHSTDQPFRLRINYLAAMTAI